MNHTGCNPYMVIMLQAIDIGLVVYNTAEQTGYISSATAANDSVSGSNTTPADVNSSTTGKSNLIEVS